MSVADQLRAIADKIEKEPERWGQGSHFDWSECACVLEHLCDTDLLPHDVYLRDSKVGPYIAQALGVKLSRNLGFQVMEWNDADERKFADVTTMLRKAADLAEQSQ